MPPSASDLELFLARQLLPRSKHGRLPVESCPVPPRWSGSVPWAPMRRSSRTVTNTSAGYGRRIMGRLHLWRCGPPQPHFGHTTTVLSLYGSSSLLLVCTCRVGAKKNQWRWYNTIRSSIVLQPPPRPPLGLLSDLHRARVSGVSNAHHEEVGGHLAPPASSPGSTVPGPRGRCH